MTIAIREFTLSDVAALGELVDAVQPGWVDLMAPSASGPMAFLADPATFVFGAYVDDAPAGLAWGARMRYPNGRVVSYLHQLDVLEQYRRRGIATRLIEAAMALARRQGHSRFWLSTGAHNETARRLYESLGGDHKPLGDVNFWWELG